MYARRVASPERTITDNELIEGVLAGDRDLYAELVRRHHARVLGLCASLLGDADADDAAQEVFLKAYSRLRDFRADAAFSTWLYRIASNHCLDERRRRARRASDSLDALTEAESDRLQAALAEPGDAARGLEDADLAEKALAALPPDYRLILTLREVEGLDYKEIMEAMDCSLDSVKARLRRARALLRETCRHLLPSGSV
ncbi:MAG: sigma-70 family RNA polymerase sigma factor [Elusimicrobia bacterium]|nr:sigma-70 family RNA polymerase sigma factor [Elusimicrobiota bacterium]